MTDTPRTDALEGAGIYSGDHARQLERELTAAKGEVDFLASAADKFCAMWRNKVQDLIRDKDQLRAEVERLRAELDRRTTLDPAKEMLGWTPKEPK